MSLRFLFCFFALVVAPLVSASVVLTATTTGTIYSETNTITGVATLKSVVILGGNVSRVTYSFTFGFSPSGRAQAGELYILIGGVVRRTYGGLSAYSSPNYTFDFPTNTGTVFQVEVGTGGTNSPDASRKKVYTIAPNETIEANEPQTVTVTPTSASLLSGNSAGFTASGGHNGYTWSISGGGLLASSGASATVEAGTTAAVYTLKVFSPAGSGYAKSNEATATITVSLANRVRVSIKANPGAWPVEYTVMQDGVEIASYTQMPGASGRIISQVVPGTGPVTVLSRQVGISQEDTGSWTVNPDGAGPVTTSPPITPNQSNEPPAVDLPAPSAPTAPGPTEGSQSLKPVWSSVAMNNDPANQTDLLTNTTFREGVDKQVENLASIKVALDQMKADGAEVKEQGEHWMAEGGGVAAFWASSQAKLTEIAGMDADKLSDLAVTSSSVAPITKSLKISLGADIVSGLPDGNFKLEPLAAFPWLETMLTVIREIILWGMAWMFYTAAQKKLEGIQFALSMVPQVDVEPGEQIIILGVSVPGSATAISLLKRVFVGGAIIGTIHIQIAAAITALNSRMGDIFGGWSFSSVGNIGSAVSSASGPMGTAFRIMDLVFPITASIAYIVAWALFSWACMLIYGVASAAIKAIKI